MRPLRETEPIDCDNKTRDRPRNPKRPPRAPRDEDRRKKGEREIVLVSERQRERQRGAGEAQAVVRCVAAREHLQCERAKRYERDADGDAAGDRRRRTERAHDGRHRRLDRDETFGGSMFAQDVEIVSEATTLRDRDRRPAERERRSERKCDRGAAPARARQQRDREIRLQERDERACGGRKDESRSKEQRRDHDPRAREDRDLTERHPTCKRTEARAKHKNRNRVREVDRSAGEA